MTSVAAVLALPSMTGAETADLLAVTICVAREIGGVAGRVEHKRTPSDLRTYHGFWRRTHRGLAPSGLYRLARRAPIRSCDLSASVCWLPVALRLLSTNSRASVFPYGTLEPLAKRQILFCRGPPSRPIRPLGATGYLLDV